MLKYKKATHARTTRPRQCLSTHYHASGKITSPPTLALVQPTLYSSPSPFPPPLPMFDNEEYAHGRRRSVDVGGLALALENPGLGNGWGGWEQVQQGETRCDTFPISCQQQLNISSTQICRIAEPDVYPDTNNRRSVQYEPVWPLYCPVFHG